MRQETRKFNGLTFKYLGAFHWMEAESLVRVMKKDFQVRTEIDEHNKDKLHVYVREER